MSPAFHVLQGVFPFTGAGLERPVALGPDLRWTVPAGARGQVSYFRGGNSSGELVIVVLLRDGAPARWFPIGARGDVHVPLRGAPDLEPGAVVELGVCAPESVAGSVVVDLGLVEV